MKQNAKKIISLGLAILIIATVFIGCSKEKASNNGMTDIVMCICGEEPKDLNLVLGKINEKLNSELGVNLKLEFLTMDNYNLIFSSGESFDLISTPDWLSYWDNASKGAFSEITDDELVKFAPYLEKQNKKYINAGNLEGKRYAIAACKDMINKRCYLVRGDFMDKYGVEPIKGIDGFGKYLDAVAKNEKDIIPFDIAGSSAWNTAAMFIFNLGWVSPGEGSAASPIFTSLYDENKKIFKAIDTPEMKDFSLKMKEWNSKGYWSKSAMSSKIGSVESFKNGRSASAFSNLEEINTMYEEFQKDDRKSWDIRAYLVYDKVVTASSSMSEAISISAGTKNKEKALKTIDLLYSDKDLYRLLTYGVSGVHYEEIEPGVKKDLDNVSYPNVFTGIGNQEYDMKGKMTLPEAPRIEDEIKSVYFEDPTVNYRRDLSNFTEIVASLNNVYLKYTAPRMLGFVDDVDAAIAVEKQKLKEAGIDEYVSAVQSQLDKYLADNKN